MTKQTRSRQQQRTRKALMDATIKLIILHGYDTLTITAICQEADYTRRAFYLHFKSRDDIVQCILVEWFLKYQQDLMEAIQVLDSPVREYTLWNNGLNVISKNITFFRQLPDLLTHDLGVPIREAIGQAILGNIVNNEVKFREGITPELLARMDMNLMGMVVRTLKQGGEFSDAKQLVDDHFRLIFNQEPPNIEV